MKAGFGKCEMRVFFIGLSLIPFANGIHRALFFQLSQYQSCHGIDKCRYQDNNNQGEIGACVPRHNGNDASLHTFQQISKRDRDKESDKNTDK